MVSLVFCILFLSTLFKGSVIWWVLNLSCVSSSANSAAVYFRIASLSRILSRVSCRSRMNSFKLIYSMCLLIFLASVLLRWM